MDQGNETTHLGSAPSWQNLVLLWFQRTVPSRLELSVHPTRLTPSLENTGQGLKETGYQSKQCFDLPLSQTFRCSDRDKCECGRTLRQESVSRLTCEPMLFTVLYRTCWATNPISVPFQLFSKSGCYDLELKELYSIDIWEVTRSAFLFGCCPCWCFFKNRKISILRSSLRSQCLFLLAYRWKLYSSSALLKFSQNDYLAEISIIDTVLGSNLQ